MARKAMLRSEEMADWAMPKFWVATAGYASPKPTALLSDSGRTIVLLHVEERPVALGQNTALREFASAAQRLLLPGDEADDMMPSTLLILDLTSLMTGDAARTVDAEGAAVPALAHRHARTRTPFTQHPLRPALH